MNNNNIFNLGSQVKAPCKNCPDRSAACRPKCFRWAYYEMEKDLERQEREKEYKTRFGLNSIETNRIERVEKGRLRWIRR